MNTARRHSVSQEIFRGSNGVVVTMQDETATYGYANLFHVKLRVFVRVPGEMEPRERILERMGVWEEDMERVRRELLASFEKHTLPYLSRSDFPERLRAFRKASERKVVSFPGVP